MHLTWRREVSNRGIAHGPKYSREGVLVPGPPDRETPQRAEGPAMLEVATPRGPGIQPLDGRYKVFRQLSIY